MNKILLTVLMLLNQAVHANEIVPMQPPKAKPIMTPQNDPYRWLNQRDNPEVLSYLKAENEYTDFKMQPTQNLQNEIFEEIKNRIKQDDSTVPVKKGDYYYFSKTLKDKNYPIYYRKKESLSHPEEVILDVNELAKGHEYYDVGSLAVSPDGNKLAYADDTVGRRKYTVHIKDLVTKQNLIDTLVDMTEDFEWANDSQTLFYVKQDPVTLRACRVYRHLLGTPTNDDTLVFEEKDDAYGVGIGKTKSKQYLMIGSFKKNTTEFRILNANQPKEDFRVFAPRKEGREYFIGHHQDLFFISTNDNAPNFKLMQCPVNNTGFEYWKPFIPYDPTIYLDSFDVFENFIVLTEVKLGLTQLKVHPFNNEKPYYITFDDEDYSAGLGPNPEYHSTDIRFDFSSLKTPTSVYDFDTLTKTKILKKQIEIGGGYHSNDYDVKRLYAKARDGVMVPISLVYKKDQFKPHNNPLYLEGYGSYGVSVDSDFNPYVISLLNRGFVYALVHVRGGSELGREWYFNGKLLKKKNTFNDFIDSAEFLIQQGLASPKKLYATGASAGGLLMGAVMNMRPDLFNGIIAEVPFVDVINTMMDPNIPLTTGEYVEWGNPNEKTYYDYMLSYSPYDNVHPADYPNMLVIASYVDSQVQYWEAAKWVARLRELKTDHHLLLLRVLMNASHSGVSGRDDAYRQVAFKYAFLLGLERGMLQ